MARTFTLIMECENAAFEDDINAEAARYSVATATKAIIAEIRQNSDV